MQQQTKTANICYNWKQNRLRHRQKINRWFHSLKLKRCTRLVRNNYIRGPVNMYRLLAFATLANGMWRIYMLCMRLMRSFVVFFFSTDDFFTPHDHHCHSNYTAVFSIESLAFFGHSLSFHDTLKFARKNSYEEWLNSVWKSSGLFELNILIWFFKKNVEKNVR